MKLTYYASVYVCVCVECFKIWVPPFYSRLWWIVYACGLFLENVKRPEGMRWGGVAHLDGALVFHCFHFKNEWVHSFSWAPESVFLYFPQSFFALNIFSHCVLNSWLITLYCHTVMGMSHGQTAAVKLEFTVSSAMSLTLNGGSCSSCFAWSHPGVLTTLLTFSQ